MPSLEIEPYVAHLARIVFPGSAMERNMAMFSAYFDESTGNDSPILVLAGLLAADAQWSLFESEWKAALKDHGVTAFHAAHFATRKFEFRGMEESTRQSLLGRLLDVIQRRVSQGFGCAIHVREFEAMFTGKERAEIGSPYTLCCISCAEYVGAWAKDNCQIEPVGYFFDSGHRYAGEAFHALIAEKNNPENIEYRIGPITFDSDTKLIPLQAADLAAYEFWKWLDEHYAGKKRHGRYPLQEIIRIPWKIREFDRDVLLELREVGRGAAPGNPRTVRNVIPALRPGRTDP